MRELRVWVCVFGSGWALVCTYSHSCECLCEWMGVCLCEWVCDICSFGVMVFACIHMCVCVCECVSEKGMVDFGPILSRSLCSTFQWWHLFSVFRLRSDVASCTNGTPTSERDRDRGAAIKKADQQFFLQNRNLQELIDSGKWPVVSSKFSPTVQLFLLFIHISGVLLLKTKMA